MQTKDAVVVHVEMIHDARIIHLDRRSISRPTSGCGSAIRSAAGKGATLVVDTTNFNDGGGFYGDAGGNFGWDRNLHLVERFSLLDADTLLYRFEIDNPTAFTQPWKGELTMARSPGPIYEYACHEGNYALIEPAAADIAPANASRPNPERWRILTIMTSDAPPIRQAVGTRSEGPAREAARPSSWSDVRTARGARDSRRSTARTCSIRRITTRCSSAIGIRRSSSSATTASAVSTPPRYSRQQGFRNLYNLRGGIDAWSMLVDPSVPRY